MTEDELILAEMIAVNSGDVRDMMTRLIDKVRRLTDEKEEREKIGEAIDGTYSRLAQRTASKTWFQPSVEQEDHLVETLFQFARLGRWLDAHKASMFYGKPLEQPEYLATHHALLVNIGDTERVHGIVGIASEAAELVENMLLEMQHLKFDLPIDQHEHDEKIRANYGEEQGDLDWFQECLASSRGMISVEDARRQNIAKLAKRYPDKFTTEAAIARADKLHPDLDFPVGG